MRSPTALTVTILFCEMIMTKTCAGVFIHNLNPYIWEFSFWTHNLPFIYIIFHHQRLWILLHGEEERGNSAVTEKVGTSLKTIHLISQSVDLQLFTTNLSFQFFCPISENHFHLSFLYIFEWQYNSWYVSIKNQIPLTDSSSSFCIPF